MKVANSVLNIAEHLLDDSTCCLGTLDNEPIYSNIKFLYPSDIHFYLLHCLIAATIILDDSDLHSNQDCMDLCHVRSPIPEFKNIKVTLNTSIDLPSSTMFLSCSDEADKDSVDLPFIRQDNWNNAMDCLQEIDAGWKEYLKGLKIIELNYLAIKNSLYKLGTQEICELANEHDNNLQITEQNFDYQVTNKKITEVSLVIYRHANKIKFDLSQDLVAQFKEYLIRHEAIIQYPTIHLNRVRDSKDKYYQLFKRDLKARQDN